MNCQVTNIHGTTDKLKKIEIYLFMEYFRCKHVTDILKAHSCMPPPPPPPRLLPQRMFKRKMKLYQNKAFSLSARSAR